MTLYKPKNPATFEALTLPDGSYAFVAYGKLTTMAKGEFEAAYEPVPFVKTG